MAFVRIQKQRIPQIILEQLLDLVKSGELKAGDRLPSERDLAERLSVSRTAVREAISMMDASGLIRIAPGIGVFLTDAVTEQQLLTKLGSIVSGNHRQLDIVKVIEARQGIEAQAAYLAAHRRSEPQLEQIRNAYAALENSLQGNLIGAEDDMLFHMAIVNATDNPLLIEAVKLIQEHVLQGLYESRRLSKTIPGLSEKVLKEHYGIMQAIEARDAEKAQRLMWEHLENVKARYSER